MLAALDEVLSSGRRSDPDVVLLATGRTATGRTLSEGWPYELDDFAEAARRLSDFSYEHCAGRLLAGGAGGYRADDWTPQVWFAVFMTLATTDVGALPAGHTGHEEAG
jgi:acetoin utilization deacetylase AcuC-like enzyme